MNPFDSPKSTLRRARHHIKDLEAQVLSFIAEKPWTYAIEQDSDTGEHVHKIRFTQRMPDEWPNILFDAVNNLRATLDQVAYASAIAASCTSLKHIKFPFSTAEEWKNAPGQCKDLPAEIQRLFLEARAYKGGNNTLWAINNICNTQKHFALIPFAAGQASLFLMKEKPVRRVVAPEPGIALRFEGGEVGYHVTGAMSSINPSWNAAKNEIVLLKTSDGAPSIRHQPDVSINIAIDGIDILRGKPAIRVLADMLTVVLQILATAEVQCRGKGWIA
jgi:hypothetical protein